MNNKDDIEKLNKQIDSLLNKEREEDNSRQVIIDRQYAYDDTEGNTKRLDTIKDIKITEEDKTKKITRVERLESLEEEVEKESIKKTNIIIYCAIAVVIVVILVLLFLVINNQ